MLNHIEILREFNKHNDCLPQLAVLGSPEAVLDRFILHQSVYVVIILRT